MDFTWPMSGGYERGHDVGRQENSAMDFVVGAWSLFRGMGREGKENIASASLAAAGGSSPEKDVDFVKHTWALYQQAMDEGWVTEWVEQFTTPDVFLSDSINRPSPYTCQGREEICAYYNTVLERVWDNGRATITWTPRSFSSLGKGSGVVMAEFDVDVIPKGTSHSRQLWIYTVQNGKLAEIRMFPLAETAPHRAPQQPRHQGNPPPDYNPHLASPTHSGFSSPHGFCATNAGESMPDLDSMSCVSMPSYAESIPRTGPVGVALTRPCTHNSWDNVRIKRGWAILRCRICQSQWRLRPTTIPHCNDFARGAGVCPSGVECSQLHVHRTRESSELKRQLQTPVPSYGTSTTTQPSAAVYPSSGAQVVSLSGTNNGYAQGVGDGGGTGGGVEPATKNIGQKVEGSHHQQHHHHHPAASRSLSQGVPAHPQICTDHVQQPQQASTYDEPYRGTDGGV